jgi:hypothetical protein
MGKKLEGNTATLVLSNCFSLTILVNDSGDGVQYQYNGGNDDTIYETEIEYIEDTENRTGYADTEDGLIQPAFKTEHEQVYFLGEFMRDNYGR